MKKLLQIAAISALALLPATTAHAQVSFGIRIGPPPPPPVYTVPRDPGPDYEWVDGYWYRANNRWVWHKPYWTRPPYAGAYWVAPYYYGGQYYEGHWEGPHGDFRHNHAWDRGRDRDDHRYDNNNGNGRARGR